MADRQPLHPWSEDDASHLGVPKRVARMILSARLVWPFTITLLGLVGCVLSAVLLLAGGLEQPMMVRLLLVASFFTLVGVSITALRLRSQLLTPLARLEESVAQVCQGEPGASVSLHDTGVLSHIVRDIDSINVELTDLYEDMDSRVARHTTRLAQKTASLKILYDVAASVNQPQDLDDLLVRFLRVLKEMVNGLAITVRVSDPEGAMRMVGSIGLDNDLVREQELLPLQLCLCGTALSPGDILCEHNARHCTRNLGRRMFGSDEIEIVTVPLQYQDEVLGLYNIFVKRSGVSAREDIMELLQTVGTHLGMAVAKSRSDLEARNATVMAERTALAHELHDSLAQTLSSLRFQMRLLEEEVLKESPPHTVREDLLRLRNGLDEANTELRELLASFRAPVGQRGLVNGVQALVDRFGEDTGLHVLFQNECGQAHPLSTDEEMQMLRIVQEALANIRKHAQAQTVRVLLKHGLEGCFELLIEDDGAGFDQAERVGKPGEHIGLSIMDERARRLGGELRIESEPGEGTRVELSYVPPDKGKVRRAKGWS